MQALLEVLQSHHLIHQYVPGRYSMHDLVHLYASERCTGDMSADDRGRDLRRLVAFYLHTTNSADLTLFPRRTPLALDGPPFGCLPKEFDDMTSALAWLKGEYRCLLAAQELAAASGWDTQTWQLAWTLDTFYGARDF
ncbi:hypothetical protein NKH77_34265 [Streptomyces sp. M19]